MAQYILDQRVEPMSGKNEVHTDTCHAVPRGMTREELGEHQTCQSAVALAKERHPSWQINGCKYCTRLCHAG